MTTVDPFYQQAPRISIVFREGGFLLKALLEGTIEHFIEVIGLLTMEYLAVKDVVSVPDKRLCSRTMATCCWVCRA